MKPVTPRGTAVTQRSPERRHYTPLVLAAVLAALVWAVIAWGGAALGAWLA
jgi:hypothetical protein